MERAKIIVKGEVQGVGYRGIVRKIARKQDIVGRIRNIKPYDVEIIAEGGKENLESFIGQIKVREFPIDVEDAEVKFEPATGEFESFEVEKGSLEEELGERLDIARDVMTQMVGKQEQTTLEIKVFREESGNKQDQMLDKQDQMLDKQDETIESINKGFTETKQDFTTLRDDYGKISSDISIAIHGIEQVVRNTEQILEHLTQQQQDFTQAINGLTGAMWRSFAPTYV